MINSTKHYRNAQIERDLVFKSISQNAMEIASLNKVSLSLSHKEALKNSNQLLTPLVLMNLISGQKPSLTKSKKSIAQFKLREGKVLGSKVSLRNQYLDIFLEKFLYLILPQVLENIQTKIKLNRNSINLGIQDLSIFPELENQYELLKKTQGLNINMNLRNQTKNPRMPFYFFSSLKLPLKPLETLKI